MRRVDRLSSFTVASFLLQALHNPLRSTPRPRLPPAVHLACARPFSAARRCRSVVLLVAAKAKKSLGHHKLLAFERYLPPSLANSERRINLWTASGEDRELIAKDISLTQLRLEHMRPSGYLMPVQPLEKSYAQRIERLKSETALALTRDYYIANYRKFIAKDMYWSDWKKGHAATAAMKQIHLQLTATAGHMKILMDRAYSALQNGSRVEFSLISPLMKPKKAQKAKANTVDDLDPDQLDFPTKAYAPGIELWNWILTHFPHLRPDIIMASMPPGTYLHIGPFSDGFRVKWVFHRTDDRKSRKDISAKIEALKVSVKRDIEMGLAEELPAKVRKVLIKRGHADYSLDTGRPKLLYDGLQERRWSARWGEESLEKSAEIIKARRAWRKLTRAKRSDEKRKDEEWLEQMRRKKREQKQQREGGNAERRDPSR